MPLYDAAFRRARRSLGKFAKPKLYLVDAPASDLGCLGAYDYTRNKIEINKAHTNKAQLVDTLRHELIHAYLHTEAENHNELFKRCAKKLGALIDY